MKVRTLAAAALAAALVGTGFTATADAAPSNRNVQVNVVLTSDITDAALASLAKYGTVTGTLPEIDGVTMNARLGDLGAIRALSTVFAANPDAPRVGKPVPISPYTDTTAGYSTWNLDQIDVTEKPGAGTRVVPETGQGVYVAVLDTGLMSSWRTYFSEDRIATEYATAFGGGGNSGKGNVSQQPNKWQTDTNGHGTHVTSTILGYNVNGTPIAGVAPQAKVIPVKVLNNNGSGQSAMVAAGITYVGDLKAGPLKDSPVVINMSLGGSELDALEKAALDYAIAQGVLIVASAGNEATAGMGYPGAYEPVVSVAANGWVGEWQPDAAGNQRTWWYASDVREKPYIDDDAYITDFSSRALPGQDLDVAAPGSWILGPYQVNQGQLSYYYLGGTSMAAPHVSGLAALMAEKDGALTQAQLETTLEDTAVPLEPGCRTILSGPGTATEEVCWGADATGHGIVNAVDALAATP